ncbi:MAG: hypothetical protein MUF12_01910 [Sediminibacterium sp.]|jgi:hypothetical protein|nr:hypothetical protein [Sediminibacterium sp.]
MNTFGFWQKWLTWANVITLLIGLLVAFVGNSSVFELHNTYTQKVFFQGTMLTNDILHFKNWLFGIIGGTIVGFHVLMIAISENAFKKQEKWAYYSLWIGLLSWFFIDSSISIFYGAIHNVFIINIPALLIIGLPLVMTFKDFRNR